MFRIDVRTMLMMAAFSFACFAVGISYVAFRYNDTVVAASSTENTPAKAPAPATPPEQAPAPKS